MAKVKWLGAKLVKKTKKQVDKNLIRAGEFLRNQIKRSLSQGGSVAPPKHAPAGQPPYLITGTLRNSIFSKFESSVFKGSQVNVGTNLGYGIVQEKGTRRYTVRAKNKRVLANKRAGLFFGKQVSIQIKPHPFILPAFRKHADRLGRIIAGRR